MDGQFAKSVIVQFEIAALEGERALLEAIPELIDPAWRESVDPVRPDRVDMSVTFTVPPAAVGLSGMVGFFW